MLTVSWKPLPGAVETVAWLHEHAINFRLVTNTSSRTRREIGRLLTSAGIRVEREQILTAVTSAATLLTERFPGMGCWVVNDGDLSEDLEAVEVVDSAASAGVVLLGGAGASIGYSELDNVFKLADRGVPIVALHRNNRFQTETGPALDMGAFIVGLEAAAGIEIPVVGKPAATFFHSALAALGSDAAETAMVGDDIESDVLGAQAAGMVGVLVRTGKFRSSDLDGRPAPDYVIGGIGDLPGIL